MRNIWLLAGAAALAAAAPSAADKGGKDRGGNAAKVERGGKGKDAKADRRGGDKARGGGGKDKAAKAERRGGGKQARVAERGEARERGPKRDERRAERGPQRGKVKAERKAERREPERFAREDRKADRERDVRRERLVRVERERRDDRRDVRTARYDDRRDDRRDVRTVRYDDRRDRDGYDRRDSYPVRYADSYRYRASYDGCPPGLARKNNGCLPPGQAKKLVGQVLPAAFATSLLPAYYRSWYPDNDDYYYRTGGDDWIYRIDRDDGLVDGYMPLFDYADYDPDYYYVGEPYPVDYVSFYNVPAQYQRYYADEDEWMYRYGDGAIYRVDRSSGLVDSIVQLLAGDLAVGQPLPAGYDVYNLPYAYRDQYQDSPEHWYRYNDGYIYQVDPTTRLIQAVVQALV